MDEMALWVQRKLKPRLSRGEMRCNERRRRGRPLHQRAERLKDGFSSERPEQPRGEPPYAEAHAEPHAEPGPEAYQSFLDAVEKRRELVSKYVKNVAKFKE